MIYGKPTLEIWLDFEGQRKIGNELFVSWQGLAVIQYI